MLRVAVKLRWDEKKGGGEKGYADVRRAEV